MSKHTYVSRLARPTALIIGTLIIAVFVFSAASEFDVIDHSAAKRVVAIAFGVMLIVTGNLVPKFARALDAQGRHPVHTIAAERFAGRTFVLAGIIYIAVWILAPWEYAMPISSAIGLSAFLLAGAAWVWLARGAQPSSQQNVHGEPFVSRQSALIRLLLFAILHTLVWIFAIFFVDSIWGGRISLVLLIPFTVGNTILAYFLRAALRRAEALPGE